jgi:hypothetical protein
VGDSGWDIGTAISPADQASYLATRAAQGFNALLLEAIVGRYDDGKANWSTFDGIVPFYQSDGIRLGTGPSNYDVTKPNPPYWARIDNVVKLAQHDGITVFLLPLADPAFQDNPRFYASQGTAKLARYATWLADRYMNYPNVEWDWAADYWPSLWSANDRYLTAMANAVRAVLPNSLQTIELNDGIYFSSHSPDQDISTDDPTWTTYHDRTHAQVDINWVYDSRTNSPDTLRAYDLARPLPTLSPGEGVYENATRAGLAGHDATLRAYLYNPILNGGIGMFYGENTVWWNGPGWPSLLATAFTSSQLGYWKALMESVSWWALVPDQSHSFVTAGYTTSAVSSDGSLGMAYFPSHTTLTVNMTKMRGPTLARWFDPTDGENTTIASGLPNTGSKTFTPPATNAAGGSDWVLELQA